MARSVSIPSFKKLIVQQLSSEFRKATQVVSGSIKTINPGEVIIKNSVVGINASDLNFTAGKYLPGVKPPFDVGFESVGEVVEVGEGVKNLTQGDAVACTGYGCFSEYMSVPSPMALQIPKNDAMFLPLRVSGLTASLALEKVGELGTSGKQETVLVTAAAGGTGQFAVQLAKLGGHKVIGTCSSESKRGFLEELGCDEVINYKTHDLRSELRRLAPRGLDVVYESVGGDFFEASVDHLREFGRVIVIGFISGYQDGSGWYKAKKEQAEERKEIGLHVKLLQKSASVRGFFLNNFSGLQKHHMLRLSALLQAGKIQSCVDPNEFQGVEKIPDAVEYLYSGQNVGKVVVSL